MNTVMQRNIKQTLISGEIKTLSGEELIDVFSNCVELYSVLALKRDTADEETFEACKQNLLDCCCEIYKKVRNFTLSGEPRDRR